MSIHASGALPTVHVDQVVEQGRFGTFQFGLLLLCGLCLIIDGFENGFGSIELVGLILRIISNTHAVARSEFAFVLLFTHNHANQRALTHPIFSYQRNLLTARYRDVNTTKQTVISVGFSK